METYDLVVIGAGPGGYPAAIRGAQLGARVAVIERECHGGTCLNWGCIPTKTLIAASTRYWDIQHAARFGIQAGTLTLDYTALLAHKNSVVEKLRGGVGQLLKAHGVTVLDGIGSFTGRNRIAISGGKSGMIEIGAAHTVIATGSTAVLPGFLPKSERVVDSRGFLDLPALPKRLIVMGGGIIGCELACLAAQLGAEVTVVELLEDILLLLDPDVRGEVRKHMESALKIRVLTGKPLEDIKASATGIKGKIGDQSVEADVLLVAVGRRPVTDGLALDKVGLKTNDKGFIEVDGLCQTKAATVYAVGDVNGGVQLAHWATAQGELAAEAALGHRRARPVVVPSCIFTAPEVGTAGLSEADAKAQNRTVRIGKFPFAALGKAMASGESAGFVKWIADTATGQLLGAAAVGPHATELIAEATVAIEAELTATAMAHTVHAHPTLAEAWMEAANLVEGHCVHLPPKRKERK